MLVSFLRILAVLSIALSAIALGAACVGVDTWSNLEFMAGGNVPPIREWNSLMAAVVVVAMATAASLAAAGYSWRTNRRMMAIGFIVAFICGASFSLSATLDRVGSQRDGAIHAKTSSNVTINRTEQALDRARGDLKGAIAGVASECNGAPALIVKGWPLCRGYRASRDAAQAEIVRLERALSTLGAPEVEDSMGSRIAAFIPWLTPKQVQTFQPVTLPVALFLFGNLLVAFGLSLLTPTAHQVARTTSVEAEFIRPTVEVMRDPVIAALADGRRSNGDLADVLGWSEAKTSRRVKALRREGRVLCERDGRRKLISAV